MLYLHAKTCQVQFIYHTQVSIQDQGLLAEKNPGVDFKASI